MAVVGPGGHSGLGYRSVAVGWVPVMGALQTRTHLGTCVRYPGGRWLPCWFKVDTACVFRSIWSRCQLLMAN